MRPRSSRGTWTRSGESIPACGRSRRATGSEFFQAVSDIDVRGLGVSKLDVSGNSGGGYVRRAPAVSAEIFTDPAHLGAVRPPAIASLELRRDRWSRDGGPAALDPVPPLTAQKVYSDPERPEHVRPHPSAVEREHRVGRRTVTACGIVSFMPSDAPMMSSLRSGMDEVRTSRRNGDSSTTLWGTGISVVAHRELRDDIRRQRGPRREELVEARRQQEHVRIDLCPRYW